MNILVTGGAGYVGSNVVEKLVNLNHKVIVVDNLFDGNREAVSEKATFVKADVGDKELLRKVFRDGEIELVMHFAAATLVEFSMTDPEMYFQGNVVNGLNLLSVMREFKCSRMIFSSTAATYGEPHYLPIDEKHPQGPINSYGESKLMFEKILSWYHRAYGLKYNTFRYFNVAGASEKLGEDHKDETHLVPLVLQVALGKKEYVNIFGEDYDAPDGTCVRDYIHVEDLADAHILAIANLQNRPNSIYNLGNNRGYSIKEIIEEARRVTGHSIPAKIAPRRKGDPNSLVASFQKAKEELGWQPKRDLTAIISSAWKWHESHPNGYKNGARPG